VKTTRGAFSKCSLHLLQPVNMRALLQTALCGHYHFSVYIKCYQDFPAGASYVPEFFELCAFETLKTNLCKEVL